MGETSFCCHISGNVSLAGGGMLPEMEGCDGRFVAWKPEEAWHD